MAGAAYIKFLDGKYGYPALFAAYNDGPGNLEANLAGTRDLPAETIAYLTNIRIRLGDAPRPGESGLAGVARPAVSATVILTRPDGQSISIDGVSVKGGTPGAAGRISAQRRRRDRSGQEPPGGARGRRLGDAVAQGGRREALGATAMPDRHLPRAATRVIMAR